ncbi:hypothetical protein EWM64_g993 [Hericium alpestre]|uniref:Uncharacterized protein n=1 Tax=Hericium alpestre TaxID=135208 RepID=A0A4Z0A9K0_9AGAM|nr:hypothetical protein EWM64_g993 [Hericium alpestre]
MTITLPKHILKACMEFFKAANAAKVPAVLIGGGALGMHGLLERRTTKDLDINVGREILTQAFKSRIRIVERKQKQDEPGTWLWREDLREDEIRVHATYLSGGMYDVSFDIKIPHPKHPQQQELLDTFVTFSQRHEGIHFADLGPLLATKTVAVMSRGVSLVEKQETDGEDFEMTLLVMLERKQKMPKQVAKLLLKPPVLRAFLNLNLYKNYGSFLTKIDVEVNEQQAQASSTRIDAVGSDGGNNQS